MAACVRENDGAAFWSFPQSPLCHTANGLRVVVRVRVFLRSPLLSRVCRMLGIEKINKYPARDLRISNLLVSIKIIYTLALFH